MSFYRRAEPLPPPTHEEKIVHWRTRAEQYRQLGQRVYAGIRSFYEKLADDCDRVADRLEKRATEGSA